MKKLIVSLLLTLSVATSVYATSTTARSLGTNVLVSAAARSSSFIFSNTNLIANVTVAVFDSAVSTVDYTNASYDTIVYTSQSVTNIYTNYFGVLNTNIYTALVHSTNTVAAATNGFAPVFTTIVQSNSVSTVNLNYNFVRGITVTNAAVLGGATVNYTQ